MNVTMNRSQAIMTLEEIARTIANSNDYWVTELTDVPSNAIRDWDLKAQCSHDGKKIEGRYESYTECVKVTYCDGAPVLMVERLSPNPLLDIMGSIRIANVAKDDEDYRFTECSAWGEEGLRIVNGLLDMWKNMGGK